MSLLIDMTGRVFGRLTVIEMAGESRRQKTWRCRCVCGREKVVLGGNLRSGITTSCGCRQRETLTSNRRKGNKKHGMYGSPEYRVWRAMISRCHDSNTNQYHNYGGRGIHVCDSWRSSFSAFIADMGLRPSADMTIERLNNSEGYSKDNCVWDSKITQGRNKRNNRKITVDGSTRCLSEWAELTGLKRETISRRLALGWSPNDAVSVKLRGAK